MANRDLTPWRSGSPMGTGLDPFVNFRREMDRLFDDFFAPAEPRSFGAPSRARAGGVWPSLDVDETEQAYMVTAELPGIDQKDIELDLRDNALTIRGEKREERAEAERGRSYTERSFGRFERTVPFPAEIDADRVEARCENGVLRITLPKNAKARDKSHRIQIQGNGGPSAQSGQAAQSAQSQSAQSKSGASSPRGEDRGKAVG